MTLQWLLSWSNLIFLAPFAVALLYLFVYTLTGIDFASADADADVDADADADVDADADADADGGVDHDADHDAEAEGAGHGSFHAMALSWLGVGRVPASFVAMVLLLTWGAAGMATNVILRDRSAASGWDTARMAVPVALAVSLGLTRAIVMFIARFMPLNETSARPSRALVGSEGTALFAINESFGLAAVRDEAGDLHQVPCKTGPGVGPIPKGAKVRLVAYREAERTFFVASAELPARPQSETKHSEGLESQTQGKVNL
jgi:hypothetical protein